MIASHFHMQLTDCSIQCNVSVFFIHIVDASSRLIPENNSESFDMAGSSFKDLIYRENLPLCTLSFQLPPEVIPEFGFCNNLIRRKQADSIDLRSGLLLRRSLSSHH